MIYPFRFSCLMVLLVTCTTMQAQFAPQAGKPGTSAIHRDSNIIRGWATGAIVNRGWQNIADTTLGKTTAGSDDMLLGAPGNGTLSLGDGGAAVLTFKHPVRNGAGYDFVVFENGFIDQSLDTGTAFLELGFVEVSSDGEHFFRFPSTSLNDTTQQLAPFAGMRAEKIHNLAGKHVAPYGTPFDLDDLPESAFLNKQAISHIRVVDVVGTLDASFASRDANGNRINDPWPTDFPAGGFDLDAIGVIHENTFLFTEEELGQYEVITISPNPVYEGEWACFSESTEEDIWIVYTAQGVPMPNGSYDFNDQGSCVKIYQSGMYYIISGRGKGVKLIVIDK